MLAYYHPEDSRERDREEKMKRKWKSGGGGGGGAKYLSIHVFFIISVLINFTCFAIFYHTGFY